MEREDAVTSKPLLGRMFELALAAAISACTAPSNPTPELRVGGETLRGERLDNGVAVFRGIPYAAAPVGALRWKQTVPPDPRPGISDATQFGAACPQDQSNPEWYRDVAREAGRPNTEIPAIEVIAEDCLFLNIWTPNLKPDEPAAVLVWIHGGSNVNGTSFEPNYLGHRLAAKGLVVVTIQYRLGPLGFMAHPILSQEDPEGVSGYYGLEDQIAALRWIKGNIGQFGGDPARVTVAGESAGGGDIAALIDMEKTHGLFARAIIQSGALGLSDRSPLAEAEKVGTAIIGASGATSLAEMRALPWQELLAARKRTADGHYFAPIADGRQLKPTQFRADRVPVLIGSNLDEWRMYLPENTEARYQEALAEYAARNKSAVNAYLLGKYPDPATRTDRLITAAEFLCPSLQIARNASAKGQAAWLYLFTRVRPGMNSIRAYHGAEIPYMFDTADEWLPRDETDRKLTDAMTSYWVNFVTSGNPNGSDLPRWPQASAIATNALELGDTIGLADPEEYAICAMIDR